MMKTFAFVATTAMFTAGLVSAQGLPPVLSGSTVTATVPVSAIIATSVASAMGGSSNGTTTTTTTTTSN
jgi:hypothetical protein